VAIIIEDHRLAGQPLEDERPDGADREHRGRRGWVRRRALGRRRLGIAAAGTLASWIISLVGAVVLIAILRATGVFR
jgi:hypothetical protein